MSLSNRGGTPSSGNLLWGVIFVLSCLISSSSFFCAAILLKLLPPATSEILYAIQTDRYYCLLVPVTMLVVVVAVYFNYLSMSYFKHA